MRNRIEWVLVGIVLVFVLALMGTGFVVAARHGDLRVDGAVQASGSQDTPVFGVTQVYMRHENFSPVRIEVVLGTTVTWTNQDAVPHNVSVAPVVISSSDGSESGLPVAEREAPPGPRPVGAARGLSPAIPFRGDTITVPTSLTAEPRPWPVVAVEHSARGWSAYKEEVGGSRPSAPTKPSFPCLLASSPPRASAQCSES